MPETVSLSRRLARFFAGLEYEATPPEVIDKMKASLVHGLVMAFIGPRRSCLDFVSIRI